MEYLQANGGDEESIVRYAEAHNGKPSKEEIVTFLDTFGKQLGANDNSNGDRRKSFLYYKDFIPDTVVGYCSIALKPLFQPWLMAVVVVVFAALELAYFLHFRDMVEQTQVSIYLIVGLYRKKSHRPRQKGYSSAKNPKWEERTPFHYV